MLDQFSVLNMGSERATAIVFVGCPAVHRTKDEVGRDL